MLFHPSAIYIFVLLLISVTTHAEISPRIIGGAESTEGDWPFMSALMYKDSAITFDNEQLNAFYMEGTPNTEFFGTLTNCEQGFQVCENADGRICLIERGETFFTDKIANCAKGGGIAAIIYNNNNGIYLGKAEANIPAVSTSRESGLALLNQLGQEVDFGFLDTPPTFSFCGGSYIGGKWLLTAAHCVQNITPESIAVNIGGHNLETDQNNVINVENIVVHLGYDAEDLNNDIALIELKDTPVDVEPILIADTDFLNSAVENLSQVTTIGRGIQTPLGFNEQPARELPDPRLYEVDLNLVDNESCNQTLNEINPFGLEHEFVTNDMICAGNLNGGVGSCLGDSGGPLLVQQDNENYLVGLTSWGFGCAQPGVYGVYSRVPYFKNRLDEVMNGELQSSFVLATNNPKPTASVIQFAATNYSVNEEDAKVTLTINRTNNSNGKVSVDIVTQDSSAKTGEDYNVIQQTVTLGDGESSKSFDIEIQNDTLFEDDESFSILLSSESDNVALGLFNSTTITIVDDEPEATGKFRLDRTTFSVSESDTQIALNVTRIDGSENEAIVDYVITNDSAINGEDFVVADGTLIFSNEEISQSIMIDIVDDEIIEDTETFTVTISDPEGTSLGNITTGIISIEDNDKEKSDDKKFFGLASMNVFYLLMCILIYTIRRRFYSLI